MSKIDEYNDAVRGLNVLKINLTPDQENQLQCLLDEIIKEEVLPAISERIAPILAKINSPLTLVINHNPGQEMVLRTSKQQVNVVDSNSKVYTLMPYDRPMPTKPHKGKKHRNPSTLLVVRFPDGTVICEPDSNKTLIRTIEKIGVRRVLDGGYTLIGRRLVTLEKQNFPAVFKVGNFYFYTHAGNDDKIKSLMNISEALNLNLEITKIPKPKKSK